MKAAKYKRLGFLSIAAVILLVYIFFRILPKAEKTDTDITHYNVYGEKQKLPPKYDSRDDGRMPDVKDQQDIGVCWAFASLTALEASLLPGENYDFSEDNMSLNNSFGMAQNAGGDYRMSMAYLLSWQGPVTEAKDMYGDGKSQSDLAPVKHVQQIELLPPKDYNAIKQAVYAYGAVQSSLYISFLDNEIDLEYYNKDTFSYCYTGDEKPNHDLDIIGFDDNYPKENFNADLPGDGAFIAVSSWGTEFADNGRFYISYYDSNIGTDNIVYTVTEDTDNYDSISQTDMCGYTGQTGYGKETVFYSNIYTAGTDETLCAAGFYATGDNTGYRVYIVHNFENENSFHDRKLIAAGDFDFRGYYTVKLKEPISLSDNERYAVIVEVTGGDSTQPAAIECETDDLKDVVNLDDGTGYISDDGIRWESTENIYKCNVCLKAYLKKKK